jgi:hypothetical protein
MLRNNWVLLAAAVSIVANSPASSTFAISCRGVSVLTDTSLAIDHATDTLPEQLFVVDAATKKLTRLLVPRGEIEYVCSTDKNQDLDVSEGLIQINSIQLEESGRRHSCSFQVNRTDGVGTYTLSTDDVGGTFSELHWSMLCQRAELPRSPVIRKI